MAGTYRFVEDVPMNYSQAMVTKELFMKNTSLRFFCASAVIGCLPQILCCSSDCIEVVDNTKLQTLVLEFSCYSK